MGRLLWFNSFSSSICETIFDLNLTQLISQPTHIDGNILDVVFTLFDVCNIPKVSHSSISISGQTTIWSLLHYLWLDLQKPI